MAHAFHAYDAALGLVSSLRPVLEQLKTRDRALADQLRRAALEVACAWGSIDASPAVDAVLDRVLAMLWRLTHRRE